MKSSKPQWQVFLLCAAFGATNAYAAIDISQAPLETGTTVDPNIFFNVTNHITKSFMRGL